MARMTKPHARVPASTARRAAPAEQAAGLLQTQTAHCERIADLLSEGVIDLLGDILASLARLEVLLADTEPVPPHAPDPEPEP